jgi:glycosyltransferase involved in cell wall biosynthesis
MPAMTQKNKISSLVIAKNEELNIKRCIESQLKCIDEILILIDEESNDNTLNIVKNYDLVKYHIVEWEGYAVTKQKGLELVENDWVLWIDADEAITPSLEEEIIRLKSVGFTYSAYDVARRAYFLGKWIKHSGWYPSRVVRLFDKNRARFLNKEVHEELVTDGNIGNLKNDLDHFTDPDIKHYFKKFNLYTGLAAEDLFKAGKKARLSDIFFRPLFLFVKMYIIRLGLLDGFHGFVLAVFSAAYVFVKYTKLWELEKNK